MKRSILLALLFPLLLSARAQEPARQSGTMGRDMPPVASACGAQTDGTDRRKTLCVEAADRGTTGIDTLRRLDPVENPLVRLRDAEEDGSLVLEAGGFGLRLGRTHMQKEMARNPRFWGELFTDMQFGFTRLTGVDYAGYAPDERGFLDQRLGSSFHFSFCPTLVCMGLNRSRSLSLGIGLQCTIDNIRLSDNSLTLGNDGGRLIPVRLDEPADKSKIVYTSLGIPLRFAYTPGKRFRLAATLYTDFLLEADAIYKKPKEKHGLRGFRGCQCGAGATVAYAGLGVYARYTFTPLFKEGAGPDCRAFSFGFNYSFNFFSW